MPKTPRGVASADMLRMDFKMLDDRDTLRTTWPNEQLILLQSIAGRAHAGHGSFRNRHFPDTTLDDVARALRLSPSAVKAERQGLIDEIVWYVERTIAGEPPRFLLNAAGEPLLGMGTLRYLEVKAADVLRGLYLGGMRDDVGVRREVEEKTGADMGGGKSYLIDQNKMWEIGLSGDKLATGVWGGKIAEFEEKGLIVGEARRNEPGVTYQYIRHFQGVGASDDAAIVAAGFRWGLGVAVGVFFADAIDTLEKYVPVYGDQDEVLAERIAREFTELDMGRKDALLLTLWAAGVDTPDYRVPDSSLRHLLAIDRKIDLCAIESHLLTVMGVPCPVIGLSHERSSSHRFYDWVRARMETYAE
jgi:hypothetical protein